MSSILFRKSKSLSIYNIKTQKDFATIFGNCPGYNTKQSDGETPVMLEFWGMQSTSSLSSLPGSLWLGMVALDWVLSLRHIGLFDI